MRPNFAVHRPGKINFKKVLTCGCLTLGFFSLLICGGGGAWIYFGTNWIVEHEAYRVEENWVGAPNSPPRNALHIAGGTLMANAFQKPVQPGMPDYSRVPTTYYYYTGPAGMVMDQFNWFPNLKNWNTYWADARLPAALIGLGAANGPGSLLPLPQMGAAWSEPAIGVIRLNIGTHAAYGRPFQFMDFYDRSGKTLPFCLPEDGSTPKFHYLSDAKKRGVNLRFFIGDERPTLAEKGPEKFYRVLFIETIRTDLNHLARDLFTTEAFRLYLSRLTDDGIICFHTSNRYYRVVPVICDTAGDVGLVCRRGHDPAGVADNLPVSQDAHFSSEWVMVAKSKETLQRLRQPQDIPDLAVIPAGPPQPMGAYWNFQTPTGQHIWRDGDSNRSSEIRHGGGWFK